MLKLGSFEIERGGVKVRRFRDGWRLRNVDGRLTKMLGVCKGNKLTECMDKMCLLVKMWLPPFMK